ncbi:lysine-specific demethylase JMJ30 isoform X2 [Andrographis paniculata]|uniref:lysine-specific demethylase JMJ30 isoform X2 n=1 Tax=Andrographis paniculata TaxID=175694 RepID=UPI0021E7B683|nr:lysine-specific demethylase JMJ30 isoform X2 [Andrographis paniculata]
MSSSSDASLETPILDSEFESLLQRITEEGGYAFAAMAARAGGGDHRAAEAAREMAWEQLHSGPWNSVVPIWRDAYAVACLQVAKYHYASGEFKLALRALDMGLIMGGLTLREDLNLCIGKASAALRGKEVSDNGGGLQKCDFYRDFNLAEVIKSLPLKSLSCNTVEKKSGLSLEAFLTEHFVSGSPVIISDCMNHWPAKDRWNDMNYLERVAGFRTVPVEIQELKQDIVIPDYCYAGGGEIQSLNAWFGPPGTVTPLHHDPHHNILAQVVGKKYIRLYPASLSEELYPHSESMLSNSSQVDLDNIDEEQFPKIMDLEFVDCILEEGEMLYIPPKWWHYVRSLTPSFSVSFWWSESDQANSSHPS